MHINTKTFILNNLMITLKATVQYIYIKKKMMMQQMNLFSFVRFLIRVYLYSHNDNLHRYCFCTILKLKYYIAILPLC